MMDYIDALGMPFWIRWAGVVYAYAVVGGVTLLTCWPLAWLAARPVMRTRARHWTELAREAYPARQAMRMLTIFVPIIIALNLRAQGLPLFVQVSRFSFVLWGVMLSFAIALGVVLHFRRRMNLSPSLLRDWLKGVIPFLVLMGKHFVVMVVIMIALPDKVDATAVVMMAAGMALTAVFIFADGIKFLSALGLCRPAGPRLERIVAQVSREMGHDPPPRAIEIVSTMANAFALQRRNMVGATDSALELLTDDELRAICAHEVAHLEEPRWAMATRLLLPFLIVSMAWIRVMLHYGLAAAAAFLALVLFVVVLLLRLHRRMEARADARALTLPGAAAHHARALEKLHIKSLVPAVMPGKGGSHPHLYDRMLAAGVQPDYPRPAPPASRKHGAKTWVAIFLISFMTLYARNWLDDYLFAWSRWMGPTGRLFIASLTNDPWSLYDIAQDKYKAGDKKGARALFLAAAQLDPEDAYSAAWASGVNAELGDCDAAREWLDQAQARMGRHDPSEKEHMGEMATIRQAEYAFSACQGADQQGSDSARRVSE